MYSRMFGFFVASVGVLIMTVSGVCTLGFGYTLFTESFHQPGGVMNGNYMIVLIGALPFMLGFGIFYWGKSIIKKHPKFNPPDENQP